MAILALTAHVGCQSQFVKQGPQRTRLYAALHNVDACASGYDWQCLSEVATDYYCFPSEWSFTAHDFTKQLLDAPKSVLGQHGNFVDNDDRSQTNSICFWGTRSHRRN